MDQEGLNMTARQVAVRFVPPANPRQEKLVPEQQARLVNYRPTPHVSQLDPTQLTAVTLSAPAPVPAVPQGEWAAPAVQPPATQLKKKPGLVKYILLSVVTFGIYAIVVKSGISTGINVIASPYDNKKTLHYCIVLFLLTLITLGIVPLIWYSRLSGRIGAEAARRGIGTAFGKKTFWLWGVLGAFILVGPWVYTYKLLKTMNALIEDYNQKG